LGGRKGIWPVKTEWWGAGYLSVEGADLHMAQLMPLPLTTVSLAPVNPDWLYLYGSDSLR